jgi:hypothetical protein
MHLQRETIWHCKELAYLPSFSAQFVKFNTLGCYVYCTYCINTFSNKQKIEPNALNSSLTVHSYEILFTRGNFHLHRHKHDTIRLRGDKFNYRNSFGILLGNSKTNLALNKLQTIHNTSCTPRSGRLEGFRRTKLDYVVEILTVLCLHVR